MARRLSRHLFTLVAAVSLVLCAATVVQWVRTDRVQPAGPSTAAMQAALAGRIPERRLGVGLGLALEVLADDAGVKFGVDWPALSAVGVYRNTHLDLNLENVRLGEAVRGILAPWPGAAFTVEGNTVRISTRERLGASGRPPRSYTPVVIAAGAVAAAIVLVGAVAAAAVARHRGRRSLPSAVRGSTTAAAILLACAIVAASAVWAAGPAGREFVRGDRRWTLTAGHGSLRLWRTPADPAAPYQRTARAGTATAPDEPKAFDRAGFIMGRSGPPFDSWVVGAPMWSLAAVTAVLPVVWLTGVGRTGRILLRLFRLAVFGLCVLSLLACTAAGWLWWRSDHAGAGRDQVSFLRAGDRYTVHSAAGRLTLVGPPPPTADPAVRRAIDEAVAGLRDDQFHWYALFGEYGGKIDWSVDPPNAAYKSPAEQLELDVAYADRVRPLLAALEDPARFAAAHILLLRRVTGRQGRQFIQIQLSGRSRFIPSPDIPELNGPSSTTAGAFLRKYGDAAWGHVEYEGLRTALRPEPKQRSLDVTSLGVDFAHMVGEADPARLPTLRDGWHRQLDVPYGSVPYWPFVAATAPPPLLWLGVRIRRICALRRRRRLGLCLRCGYDLRGSEGRCSECGEAIAARGAA